jgi:small GTP-binding protein
MIHKITLKKKRADGTSNAKSIAPGTPLAILGKPNVGKSTLLNTFVGKELSKVENMSGTTRDYVVGAFTYDAHKYAIYDTAGIKKKGNMHGIERIAYQKTLDMLKYIRPVVLFLIDGMEGLSHRDMTLLEEINNVGLPIIIGLNKTDLMKPKQIDAMTKTIQAYLSFAKYIPIVPIVATTGKGIKDMMKLVTLVNKEMNKRIDTNKLNKLIAEEYLSRPPRFAKNKVCKILYITQTDIDAPTFMAFVNHKERANFAFKKRIDNGIRKHFGFIGTPLVIRFKARNEKSNEEETSYYKKEEKDKSREERQDKKIKLRYSRDEEGDETENNTQEAEKERKKRAPKIKKEPKKKREEQRKSKYEAKIARYKSRNSKN